jgi:hypothetical protein
MSMKNKMKQCEQQCYDKYSKIFEENKNNPYYNFSEFHDKLKSCSDNCEEIYRRVIEHQVKSSEISYVFIILKLVNIRKAY